MDTYTVPTTGRTVRVGEQYRDARRADASTLLVEAIDGPYADWRGTERCQVHYTVIARDGGVTPSSLTRTIDADWITNPDLFVLVEGVDQ